MKSYRIMAQKHGMPSAALMAGLLAVGAAAADEGTPVNFSTTTASGETVNVSGTIAPPTTTTTTSSSGPTFRPAAGADLDSHLDNSSKSLTNIDGDHGFDFSTGGGGGGVSRGKSGSSAVLGQRSGKAQPGAATHTVSKGDTLWGISSSQFNSPWLWPKVWSYNPQIKNPHWIYPGDQVRLRAYTGMPSADEAVASGLRQSIVLGQGGADAGVLRGRSLIPKSTVFLRNLGYIDDPNKDVWGELVGAHQNRLMLLEGDTAYLIMRPGVGLRLGQVLTIFREGREPRAVRGARKPPGKLIAFKGAVKINRWDPKTRIARATIIESLGEIERGAKVGPVGRRFDVVPPRRNETDLWARVLDSMYPHVIMGNQQVVFIDRGRNDGLRPGNRLLIVRRGDTWRRTISHKTRMSRERIRMSAEGPVESEMTPLHGDEKDFPEETVGEVRVIRTQKYSAFALITESSVEVEPGDRLVSRKGF